MQAPEGYHLNEETFTAQLIDGQAATVTIPDKIKTGLIIRKVDAETGEPLAGAVFTGGVPPQPIRTRDFGKTLCNSPGIVP